MKKNPFSTNTIEKTQSEPKKILQPFDSFNPKLIAKDKLGVAVDILRKHLVNIFDFSTSNGKNKIYLDILEMHKADLNFATQLLTIYDSINIINANVLQHVFQIDSKLKKEQEIIEKEINKINYSTLQEQITDYEEEILNTKNLMNLDLQCCTKDDLDLAYQDLFKSKDPYEIMIMKNIVILLSNNIYSSPENIRHQVHHYNTLTKEMRLFDSSSLSLFQLSNILIAVSQVLDQIDPTKANANNNNNNFMVEKYRHLISYALWLSKACEYLIKKIKKTELEKKLAKILNEKSKKVELMNYFKAFQELNFIIINCNQEQQNYFKSEMEEFSKKVEQEMQNIANKLEPKFYPEASVLNSLLNEEEEKILNLYFSNSNSIYQIEDNLCEMDKKSLILEKKVSKGFLCGFCGMAKNK